MLLTYRARCEPVTELIDPKGSKGSAYDRQLAEVTAAKPSLELGGQEAVCRDRVDSTPMHSAQLCIDAVGEMAIHEQRSGQPSVAALSRYT